MNTEYYIIDDIIPQSLFNKIENVLTDFNLQSWYMVPTTATDKNLTVAARIKPKRNRAVLFCGNRYHSRSAPIESDYRMTLNTNFLVKDYNYGVQNTWQ